MAIRLMADFGIVEAARRARSWMPLLRTEGQRLVLASIVLYVNADSTAHPTVGQLATVTTYHGSSVRRILDQLAALGAIIPVGSRPVYTEDGKAKGGKVTLWSIPPAPSEAQVADSHARPGVIPPAPPGLPTRALRGAPLRVERLRSDRSIETAGGLDEAKARQIAGLQAIDGVSGPEAPSERYTQPERSNTAGPGIGESVSQPRPGGSR